MEIDVWRTAEFIVSVIVASVIVGGVVYKGLRDKIAFDLKKTDEKLEVVKKNTAILDKNGGEGLKDAPTKLSEMSDRMQKFEVSLSELATMVRDLDAARSREIQDLHGLLVTEIKLVNKAITESERDQVNTLSQVIGNLLNKK